MSRILSRKERVGGFTQRELADQWVAQNNSTPEEDSPFSFNDSTDHRGRRGSLERHESYQQNSPAGVTFLGGSVVQEPQAGEAVPPAQRTILGNAETTYFAPLVNIFVDNTTEDVSGFGGYALTPRHYRALKDAGIVPEDASSVLGLDPGQTKTLRNLASFLIDFAEGQSVVIDGADVTPENVNSLRQRTRNFSYLDLPRATGAIYSPDKILADPDLGLNLTDDDPSNDVYPTIGELNPDFLDAVVPFVQEGFYFATELDSDTETLEFGGSLEAIFGPAGIQQVTYNVLNPIVGDDENNALIGTIKNDFIEGGDGRDRLIGRRGDDLLVAGAGNDVINAGRGDDELWGDEGVDKFIFGKRFGSDTVFDFEVGEKIVLRNLSEVMSIEDVTLGNGLDATQIQFNEQDSLTLVGVTSDSINVDLESRMITSSL